MIPLMGLLSDKVGRQKMYTLSVVLLGLFIVPWFLAARHRHRLGHHAGDDRCLRHPVGAGNLAVLGTLCSEIFSANVRYTGITLGYQLGAALAGAPRRLSPPVCWQKYDGGLAAGGRLSGRYGGDFAAGDILHQPDEVRVGHGPSPGGKRLTAARQGYYGARLSRPAALRLRGPTGRSRRGETALIPGPVSM